jgi:hypothetical protein
MLSNICVHTSTGIPMHACPCWAIYARMHIHPHLRAGTRIWLQPNADGAADVRVRVHLGIHIWLIAQASIRTHIVKMRRARAQTCTAGARRGRDRQHRRGRRRINSARCGLVPGAVYGTHARVPPPTRALTCKYAHTHMHTRGLYICTHTCTHELAHTVICV